MSDLCVKCGKDGATKRCARCRSAKYCSVECQKSHWSEHKKNCQAPQAEVKPAVEIDPFDDIDVRIVMGQTGCVREKAIEGLRKSKGDVQVAINLNSV